MEHYDDFKEKNCHKNYYARTVHFRWVRNRGPVPCSRIVQVAQHNLKRGTCFAMCAHPSLNLVENLDFFIGTKWITLFLRARLVYVYRALKEFSYGNSSVFFFSLLVAHKKEGTYNFYLFGCWRILFTLSFRRIFRHKQIGENTIQICTHMKK